MVARMVIIGGFLGSGKTTLINKIAKGLNGSGRRIGLIMNDQGEALVDTQFSKANGFETCEVLRGCFCCRFDDLVSAARDLVSRTGADTILAEPVGSCEDLLSTVVAPLKLGHSDELEVAPLVMVIDAPRMAQEGLDPETLNEYLRMHQVGEAEHIVISKIDMVTRDTLLQLVDTARSYNPQAEVIAYSAITGHGLDRILAIISSDRVVDRRPAEVVNGTNVRSGAELGWYNGTFNFRAREKVDSYELGTKIVRAISYCYRPGDIAHVKLMLASETGSIRVSAVWENISVDGVKGTSFSEGKVTLILNARIISSPRDLRTNIRISVQEALESTGNQADSYNDECFSSSRPSPVHHISSNGTK